MTDEEKEAIEWLKRLVKLNKRDNLDDTFAEILLNLIEKQSKEIVHWKAGMKIIEKDKNNKIERLEKELQNADKNWEDKIKAKIEEIDEVLKGQLIEKIRVYFEAQKEVLQSLLKKE